MSKGSESDKKMRKNDGFEGFECETKEKQRLEKLSEENPGHVDPLKILNSTSLRLV